MYVKKKKIPSGNKSYTFGPGFASSRRGVQRFFSWKLCRQIWTWAQSTTGWKQMELKDKPGNVNDDEEMTNSLFTRASFEFRINACWINHQIYHLTRPPHGPTSSATITKQTNPSKINHSLALKFLISPNYPFPTNITQYNILHGHLSQRPNYYNIICF